MITKTGLKYTESLFQNCYTPITYSLINIIITKCMILLDSSNVCRHDNSSIKRLKSVKSTYEQAAVLWATPLDVELNVHLQSVIE